LDVSSDVSAHSPGSPVRSGLETEVCNPLLSSIGGHDSVRVSRVLKNLVLVSWLGHILVDGVGAVLEHGVLDVAAELEGSSALDVQSSLHGSTSEICEERVIICSTLRLVLKAQVVRSVSVLEASVINGSEGVLHKSLSKLLLLSSSGGLVALGCSSGQVVVVALSKEVVVLYLGGQRVELVHQGLASGVDSRSALGELEVGVVASFHLVVVIVVNESEPVGLLHEGWVSVVLPVGDTVANCEALKVWLVVGRFSGLEVGIDSLDKLRNVDSSVGLSSNVQIVLVDFREELKDSQYCLEIIVC
jgi:hypothetical protein